MARRGGDGRREKGRRNEEKPTSRKKIQGEKSLKGGKCISSKVVRFGVAEIQETPAKEICATNKGGGGGFQ